MNRAKVETEQMYVVAVSGGVDSMVLLDMLVHNRCPGLSLPKQNLVVAHFDHGIRSDSASDEMWVRGVVGEYGLRYESAQGKLAADASEDIARQARYNFLRSVCKKYNAPLITAHHQDDVLETMIINLIRGTGWRGLVGLDSTDFIKRPLLKTPKSALLNYAQAHGLKWREDSTNQEEEYLRNYIRLTLLPRLQLRNPQFKQQLWQLYEATQSVKKEIATELQNLIPKPIDSKLWPRYNFIMWPSPVAQEILYYQLTQLDPGWHPSELHIKRALHFIKTGLPDKQLDLSHHLKLRLTKRGVQFKNG